MILSGSMGRPRASAEETTIPWEEMAAYLRRVFAPENQVEASITSAERLSPVAAAHRILTNSFGLIPFGLYRKDGEARVAERDAHLELVLKVRANDYMSPFMARKVQMSNAFWHGMGAIWNRKDPAGNVTMRLPLPTDCCSVRKDQEAGCYWYDFNVDGVRRTFANSELSLLYFETYDGVLGRGVLDLAREIIAADAMAQRYNRKFYQNGARLSGIVEVDTDADSNTRRRIKEEFRSYASEDAFLVAVLDHSMKFTPLGLSQADAQYVESRGFTVEEMARVTGIPKHMLQTGKESYDSNQQQRINYLTDTLLPFVVQAESEDSYKLLPKALRDRGLYIHGNTEVLLRADPMTRASFYEKMIQNAGMNPDECRGKEERPPIPGGYGQRFLVTKNLGSLESVLKGEG